MFPFSLTYLGKWISKKTNSPVLSRNMHSMRKGLAFNLTTFSIIIWRPVISYRSLHPDKTGVVTDYYVIANCWSESRWRWLVLFAVEVLMIGLIVVQNNLTLCTRQLSNGDTWVGVIIIDKCQTRQYWEILKTMTSLWNLMKYEKKMLPHYFLTQFQFNLRHCITAEIYRGLTSLE